MKGVTKDLHFNHLSLRVTSILFILTAVAPLNQTLKVVRIMRE